MKKISEPIVFFGNERLATGVRTTAPTLRGLIETGYEVAAVITNYEPAQSRTARELEIETVAKAYNVPVLMPKRLSDISNQIKGYGANIGVLVAYGKIIPKEIINLFPRGIVNIHPSLLPRGRGPTPIEQAILEGAGKTGVSIMKLIGEMDAGPTYAQREISLKGIESKQALADYLLAEGRNLLLDNLASVIDGSTDPVPQDTGKATYSSLLTKEDGIIDWSKPAVQLEREIRAFLGWPKSRTTLAGKDVIITAAHVAGYEFHPEPSDPPKPFVTPDGKVGVPSLSEGVLVIDRLKPAGKNEMSAEAFLAGHHDAL